ncbi:SDR family NAD(P)-dependent oxidoreductase [Glutamicibacter sp. NPDC087344]|uniref:SDR family NAD(P)-dependent oxidoreductase n=1 Tax=Glutamicibacter sp. NPDC087344 TaxID=3363994 RepID=UPI00382FCF68
MRTAELAGRVAVVTGGARGLGLSMATVLAEQGARVALLDLLDSVSEAAAGLQEHSGTQCIGLRVDITDENWVTQTLAEVAQRLGEADILVNSAGITSGTELLETSLDVWNKLMQVNLSGTFLMAREFAKRHQARGGEHRASIVNVSSMSAFAVNIPQTQAAYNTSKAGVSMFTKSAAIEWLPLGIRVNAIAPGYFATDMTKDFVAENPQKAAHWIGKIPAGRMGQPEELGGLLTFLASEQSSYVVGQTYIIDGGYTLV